jgi:hypothetical protein
VGPSRSLLKFAGWGKASAAPHRPQLAACGAKTQSTSLPWQVRTVAQWLPYLPKGFSKIAGWLVCCTPAHLLPSGGARVTAVSE